MNSQPKRIHYDRNGIKIMDKPCEAMFGFDFDDTFAEEIIKESGEEFKKKNREEIGE